MCLLAALISFLPPPCRLFSSFSVSTSAVKSWLASSLLVRSQPFGPFSANAAVSGGTGAGAGGAGAGAGLLAALLPFYPIPPSEGGPQPGPSYYPLPAPPLPHPSAPALPLPRGSSGPLGSACGGLGPSSGRALGLGALPFSSFPPAPPPLTRPPSASGSVAGAGPGAAAPTPFPHGAGAPAAVARDGPVASLGDVAAGESLPPTSEGGFERPAVVSAPGSVPVATGGVAGRWSIGPSAAVTGEGGGRSGRSRRGNLALNYASMHAGRPSSMAPASAAEVREPEDTHNNLSLSRNGDIHVRAHCVCSSSSSSFLGAVDGDGPAASACLPGLCCCPLGCNGGRPAPSSRSRSWPVACRWGFGCRRCASWWRCCLIFPCPIRRPARSGRPPSQKKSQGAAHQ